MYIYIQNNEISFYLSYSEMQWLLKYISIFLYYN